MFGLALPALCEPAWAPAPGVSHVQGAKCGGHRGIDRGKERVFFFDNSAERLLLAHGRAARLLT